MSPVGGGEAWLAGFPPGGEGFAHLGLFLLHAGVLLDGNADLGAFGQAGREIVVVRVALDEDGGGIEAVGVEEVALVSNLGLWDTAEEVGADILGLRRRSVVGVAADVAVVVVLCEFGVAYDAGEAGDVLEVARRRARRSSLCARGGGSSGRVRRGTRGRRL